MSKAKPVSFSPYFRLKDADQVRAAQQAVGQKEGYASVSELIETATLKEIRRLQRKYNNGKPWEGLPAGTARPGQRTRAEASTSEEKNR